ncbi:hypothetical protein K474DRAFT_1387434 [Panus rudis PR-1116 ss-1]|nr:hypothetical protein K474DRAFT_1387434 [Panus rudis PR-1116 ss-1]
MCDALRMYVGKIIFVHLGLHRSSSNGADSKCVTLGRASWYTLLPLLLKRAGMPHSWGDTDNNSTDTHGLQCECHRSRTFET